MSLTVSLSCRIKCEEYPKGLDNSLFHRGTDPQTQQPVVVAQFIAFPTPRSNYNDWVIQQSQPRQTEEERERAQEDGEPDERSNFGNIKAWNDADRVRERITFAVVMNRLNQKKFVTGKKIPEGATVPPRYANLVMVPLGSRAAAAGYDFDIYEKQDSAEQALGCPRTHVGTASFARSGSADNAPDDPRSPAPASAPAYRSATPAANTAPADDEDEIPF